MTEGAMFERIDTVFVRVQSILESKRWYQEKLGLQVRFENQGVVCFELAETVITLIEVEKSEEFQPLSQAAFNLYVNHIERVHQNLKERGVKVGPIQQAPGVRWFEFSDLDGNRVEVVTW